MIIGTLHGLVDPRDEAGRLRSVTYTEAVLGLPLHAHGGALLATLLLASDLTGSVRLRGSFRKPVAINVPVTPRRTPLTTGEQLELLVDGKAYVRATIERHDPPDIVPPTMKDVGTPAPHVNCFVCGVRRRNDGLRAAFYFDDTALWSTWEPFDRCLTAQGELSPLVVTALLDDAATWLGTLTTRHTVATNDFQLTLTLPLRWPNAIRVGGRLDSVTTDSSGKKASATVSIADDVGSVLACGHISFVPLPQFTGAAAKALREAGIPSAIVAKIYR